MEINREKKYTKDTKLELISHNISIVDFEYKEGRKEGRKIDLLTVFDDQDNQILLFNAFE